MLPLESRSAADPQARADREAASSDSERQLWRGLPVTRTSDPPTVADGMCGCMPGLTR